MSPSRRGRVLLLVAAAVAVLSLVANAYLVASLDEGFRKLQLARIFPLGYDPATAPRFASACDVPVVAIYGDSRAQQWDPAGLPPALRIENFGHGAQTSAQLLAALRADVATRASIAVLQTGINDLHPLGALPEESAAARRALAANLRLITSLLLARADRVVLTTLFPPDAVPLARRRSWDPATLEYIRAANDVIRSSADSDRVVVVDAYALLAGPDGRLAPQYRAADFFLHVNKAAYAELNRALAGTAPWAPVRDEGCAMPAARPSP